MALYFIDALAGLCQGRPFVVVNTELGAKMPSVVFDQRYGMRLAVEHLVCAGPSADRGDQWTAGQL